MGTVLGIVWSWSGTVGASFLTDELALDKEVGLWYSERMDLDYSLSSRELVPHRGEEVVGLPGSFFGFI